MSRCIMKIAHDCGSSDALQVFEKEDGKLDGFCFSCNTFVADPLGVGITGKDIPNEQKLGKTQEEIEEELKEIESCGSCDLVQRRIHHSSLDYYNVKVGVSERDGKTPNSVYFPYYKNGKLQGYKCRLLQEKRFWAVGSIKDVDLFGWEQAKQSGAQRLIITEGEFDACALKRIFDLYEKEEYKHTIPAIVSLPSGSSSVRKSLSKHLQDIKRYFKQVSFCFDQDDAGRAAVEEACKIIPEATSIILPCKDANECLIQGKGKEAYNASKWNAAVPKNSRLVSLDDVWEDAQKPAEFGVSWPWKHVTEVTRGIRTGETIYIGAAQKMGKSEVVNALAAHLILEHGWKILLAKPEEANIKTAKLLAGKVAHTRFHDPKTPFDKTRFEEAGKALLGQKVYMLNLYQHLGWESLKTDIVTAAALGVKAVFIDPITNLTNGVNAADANTKLQEIAQDLAAMAKDLDIVIFIFCHLRNPDSGAPHDRGGAVLTSQFAGSRAMGRSCNYMFGIEGNKDPDLPKDERNKRYLVLLDDREYGEVGRFGLYWDENTTMFNELEY